jgi:hypothetical protein
MQPAIKYSKQRGSIEEGQATVHSARATWEESRSGANLRSEWIFGGALSRPEAILSNSLEIEAADKRVKFRGICED